MLVDSHTDDCLTNDGAIILHEMDLQHPISKIFVDMAKSQDNEVGDGTTTAVVLAAIFLSKAENLITLKMHPTTIIEGYDLAHAEALKILNDLALNVDRTDNKLLSNIATTALSSKIIFDFKDYLIPIIMQAVTQIAKKTPEGYTVNKDDIKFVKKFGKSITDTQLVDGVVLEKRVVHPNMPKRVENAKVLLLTRDLKIIKGDRRNLFNDLGAKITVENQKELHTFLDEGRPMKNILKEMVETIAETGANVLIVNDEVDEVARGMLAKKGILTICNEREVKPYSLVEDEDMRQIALATGATLIGVLEDVDRKYLGKAKLVEERKIRQNKYIFISGCPNIATFVVRGATFRIMEETERSLHDVISVVSDVMKYPKVVVGGGAAETEIGLRLSKFAKTFIGKKQFAVESCADAFYSIPMILADNVGLDPDIILGEIKSRHAKGEKNVGIDSILKNVSDMSSRGIFDPYIVKQQSIKSAFEIVKMILKIDDFIMAERDIEREKPTVV